ncbi:universal stress protein [Candidatus Thiothrix anitrata]|jgi:universal stress protein A|uniref:Universal stress protein n=1 Tax=Candidatus Thiothrix anitrata TaxID=2823902 RepID=A0ABX7X4Q6_9GAMM|nr:universal stress protein [Candidatus Thiothrix anitrata]QTR50839.1 universal stress protein [Candidatus Thiothrix anitrata]
MMQPYQQLLVPIDFTRASHSIVARAEELANFYNAHVHLLHILTDATLGSVTFGGTDKLGMPPALKQNQIQLATEKLQRLAADVGLNDQVSLQVTHTTGKPSEAIIQFAKENHIDLVIVANSGKQSVLGFMGSTAEATLKGVLCDVMAIRLVD